MSLRSFGAAFSGGRGRRFVFGAPELRRLPTPWTDYPLLRVHQPRPILRVPLAAEQQPPDHYVTADGWRGEVRHKVDPPITVATRPLAPHGRSVTKPNQPYVGLSIRLLRVNAERRQKQAEREEDREPDPPHGHLGWRRLAGSLADQNYSRRAGSSIRLITAGHEHTR